jgi:hypothetical protein
VVSDPKTPCCEPVNEKTVGLDRYVPKSCCYCGSENISAKPSLSKVDPTDDELLRDVLKDEKFRTVRRICKENGGDPSKLYEGLDISLYPRFITVVVGVRCMDCHLNYDLTRKELFDPKPKASKGSP